MSFKENQYIELFNPATQDYFPIRIVSVNSDGLKAVSIILDKEIDVYNYVLNTYGYRIPSINEKLLLEIGFVKDNFFYRQDDKLIIESWVGELAKIKDYPFYFDFHSNLLGYKFFKSKDSKKIQEFIEVLKITPPSINNKEFGEEYNTSFRVEDLIKYYDLDFAIMDEAIAKTYKIK